MNEPRFRSSGWPLVYLLAIALVSFAPALIAQDEPDPVTVSVSGNMKPNGTFTATAMINDNSALESVSWEQTGGVALDHSCPGQG